jgi:hypothetical protein
VGTGVVVGAMGTGVVVGAIEADGDVVETGVMVGAIEAVVGLADFIAGIKGDFLSVGVLPHFQSQQQPKIRATSTSKTPFLKVYNVLYDHFPR